MRILYLEDNPNDAELTLRVFKSRDPRAKFITARDVHTALGIIQSHPADYFDIFLSDFELPDGDAIQFLAAIHQRGLFQPVVVVTGNDDPQVRNRTLAQGIAGFLHKEGKYLETLPEKIEKIHKSYRENRKRQSVIRVLYAEHNPVDAELTQLHFASHAAHIVLQVISSATELERTCQPDGKNPEYDVIVLDTDIQRQGDLSLFKKLKAEWKIEQPVILLTAPGEDRLTVQALQLGAENCVIKNIGYFQLLPAIIEVAFTKSRLMKEQKISLERERLFRLMTENARDIVFRLHFSPDFGFDYISAAVKRLTGYSPEEFYENPSFLMELVDPEDFTRLQQMLAKPTRFGKPILLRWHTRDGRLLWVEAKGSFIHDPMGKPVALEGIARDITERIRFEAALQAENEHRQELETIINKSPVIVVRWKPKVRQPLDYISASISSLGYKAKDFLDGKILYEEIVHPDDVKQLESEVSQHAQAKDMQYRMRYRLITKKGETRWVDDLTWVVKDDQGTPLYHQGIVTDITSQKKIEEEEQRRTQRNQDERQSIIQLALDPAVSSGDFDVAIQHITEIVVKVLGVERASIWMYTEGEDGILCTDLYERSKNHHSKGLILQARDYPTYFESLRAGRAIAAQDARCDPRTFEFTEGYLQPLGIASLLDSAIRVRSQMVGVVCFEHIGEPRRWHQDEITFCGEIADQVAQVILNLERRNAEEATRANEIKFRNIIEQSAEGFVLLDEDGFVIDWNRSTEYLFGISRDQALGQYFWDLLFQVVIPKNRTKERYERLKNSIQAALKRDDSSLFAKPIEAEIFNLKGEHISIQQIIFPLHISGKKFIASYTQNITDRKKAEQETRESEKRFKALFEQANDAIFLMDGDRFIDCNQQTETIFGAKKDEIIGKSPFIFSPSIQPDGQKSITVGSKYIQAALSGKPQIFEWVHLHKDGTPFDAEVSLNRVEIGGKPFLQAVVRDISDRKQTERAIRESENRFRSIFEQANDGIFILDANKLVDCNQQTEMLFGWNRDEFLGKTPPDLSPETQPDGRNSAKLGMEMYKLALQGQPQRFEWVHLKKDGTPFDVEVSLNRIEIRGKSMVQAIIRDITERKLVDQSLKTAEKRYRGLFEDSPISLWEEDFSGVKQIIDALKKRGIKDFHRYIQNHPEVVQECLDKVRIVDINKATLRLYGAAHKVDLLKNLNQVMTNDYLDSFAREVEEIASGIAEFHWEGINQTLSGRKIFIDMHWSAAPGFENTLARVIISIEDITARKQAELALLESETSYRTLAENLPGIVFRYHFYQANGMQWFNSMMLPLTGYTDEEVLGFDNWGEKLVLPEDDRQFHAVVREAIKKKNTYSVEYRIRKKNGEIRNFFERGQPVYDEKGNPIYVDGIILDVTERHQIESALHESEIRFRGLFEDSPVSLWEEDFSEVKMYIDGLKKKGIKNFKKYIADHPDVIFECAKKVKVLDLNRATIQLYKAKNKKDLLKNLGNIFCDESIIGVVDEVLHIAEGKYDFEGETVNQTLDGQKIDVYLHWAVAPGYEDTLSRVIISITDVTEKKKAEQELRQSEEKYRELMERMRSAVAVYQAVEDGKDFEFLDFNQRAEEIEGLKRSEVLGRKVTQVFPGVVKFGILDIFRRVWKSGKAEFFPAALYKNEKGTESWRENWIYRLPDGKVVAIYSDVTDQKKSEEVIRISEARYRGLVENQAAIISREDLDGNLTFVNEEFCRVFGNNREELIGSQGSAFILPEDRQLVSQGIAAARKSPYRTQSVNRNITAQGIRWYRWENSAILDAKGKVIEMQFVGWDITEQKQHDRELEALASISTALRKARSLDEMCPIIVNQLVKVMQAAGGLIMLEESIQGEMVVNYGSGDFAGQERYHIPAGKGISGEVKRTKKPYLSHDLVSDPIFFPGPILTRCKEAVMYPMIAQKKVIGTLLISREQPFDKTEIKVIGSIAEMAANAIFRSELHEQTENRLQKLIALRQIDNAISSTLDLHQIIDTILTSSQKFLKVDAADILLYDEESGKLKFAYSVGFRTSLMEGFSVNPGVGWAGEAVRLRKPIMILDINQVSGQHIKPAPLVEELVSYYVVPLITRNQVKGVMECFTRSPLRLDQDWEEFINLLAGQAAIAIHSAQLFDEIKKSNVQLVRAYDDTIEGWSRAMDIRDKETEGHTQRVVDLTLRLARAIGVPEEQLTHIKRGTLLHDIGKLVVPDNILFKPSALTDSEWKIMKKHPMNAYNMLASVDYLKPALDIPFYHHEHWDGSGYPRGLKGEEIPLAARIFSVVDIWDALLSDRPYRPAWSKEKTLAYIKRHSGKDLDPKVVKAFLKIISEPK